MSILSRSVRSPCADVCFPGSTRQVQGLGDRDGVAGKRRVCLQESRRRPPAATVEVCDGGGGTTSRGPQQDTQGTVSSPRVHGHSTSRDESLYCDVTPYLGERGGEQGRYNGGVRGR